VLYYTIWEHCSETPERKQFTAERQTVHGVFCQTITKSCQIHC